MTTNSINQMNSSFWESRSAKDMVFLFRFPELVFFLTVEIVLLSSLLFIDNNSQLYLPGVISLKNISYDVLANNPHNSYPIKLGGKNCLPHTLLDCKRQVSDICCAFCNDENTFPYAQVNSIMLFSLAFLLPCLLLTIRTITWRKIHRATSCYYPTTISDYFWLRVFWDGIVSIIFCSLLQQLFVFYLKQSIGYPRPNYYALNIWANINPELSSIRQDFADQAHRSFPSGHSSWSMSTLGYLSLLVFHDALSLLQKYPYLSKMLFFIGLSIFFIPIYVGSTRIQDYWHFPIDVTAGWLFGLLVALCSFYFMSDSSLYILKKLKIREEMARVSVEEEQQHLSTSNIDNNSIFTPMLTSATITANTNNNSSSSSSRYSVNNNNDNYENNIITPFQKLESKGDV